MNPGRQPPAAPDPQPTSSGTGIRVFIAEDHAITLWGLQRLIDAAQPGMRVVGTASTRAGLLNDAALPDCDVILLDLNLGGEDAIDALHDVQRRCAAHILVLTAESDVALHRAAVVRGARGVLHKSEPAQTILQAIEKVHCGELWLNRSLVGTVLGQLTGANAPARNDDVHARRIASLTPREREIVVTIVRMSGAKQLAVADQLRMSEHTLRNHLTTIYSKLAVNGRLALHLYAIEHGLAVPAHDKGRA